MNKINFIDDPYPNAEMLPYERETLYKWIIEIIKPKNIIEIGTGVGGSTYFMGKALETLKYGEIHTCDPDRRPPADFFIEFKNVHFYPSISSNMIDYLLEKNINIDYIFFDGPENPMIAMNDIIKLENYIKPGCYFSMHDWEITARGYDGAVSTKALYIRPYIENSKKWIKIDVLSGIEKNLNTNKYDSVGLCLYQFVG